VEELAKVSNATSASNTATSPEIALWLANRVDTVEAITRVVTVDKAVVTVVDSTVAPRKLATPAEVLVTFLASAQRRRSASTVDSPDM
jgi:hypothetical protein